MTTEQGGRGWVRLSGVKSTPDNDSMVQWMTLMWFFVFKKIKSVLTCESWVQKRIMGKLFKKILNTVPLYKNWRKKSWNFQKLYWLSAVNKHFLAWIRGVNDIVESESLKTWGQNSRGIVSFQKRKDKIPRKTVPELLLKKCERELLYVKIGWSEMRWNGTHCWRSLFLGVHFKKICKLYRRR